MRACFLGQNIYVLGNGIAVLNSGWRELESPKTCEPESSDKAKPEKNGLIKPDRKPAN